MPISLPGINLCSENISINKFQHTYKYFHGMHTLLKSLKDGKLPMLLV